ncbi:MAG: 16S rRNA (adenine(1518)-N(6)/adenine(1519)-N(6))-dimethyltransferase RsmA [Oscillospiraceae bacterium]|nr:16S rRNA (adenine(1518)-N(6)/adenine(1519)-N(6))-dimethyltransferase RsmA [Oscillospiraceae bacterium]
MNLTDYNEIRSLLHRHGFRFSKSMGQNFLVASWVPKRIAENARLDEHTAVLEIGPGVGCLTEQLARRAGKVLAVELDRSLAPVLRETLEGYENVELLFGDILKHDIPSLVHAHFGGMRAAVCANLPYNVTSPLLTALLRAGCFETITVMIQREVARRICAAPNTPDYGAFSLLVQWYTEPELLFDVQPHCFHPQPKVTSSVIRLTRRAEKPFPVSDEDFLFNIIRAAFNQRRKTLPNALSSGLDLERGAIERVLENCGLDAKIRGEALDLAAFVEIADELAGKKAKTTADL